MYIVGDQLRGSMRTVDTQSLPDSVITENESIIPRLYATPYNDFTQIWHASKFLSLYICINT